MHSHVPYGGWAGGAPLGACCCPAPCPAGHAWRVRSFYTAGTMRRAAPPTRLPRPPTCPPGLHPPPPPAVLLIKAAKQWQAAHGGGLPSTAAERAAFKDLLRGWQRQVDGFPLEARRAGPAGRAAVGWHARRGATGSAAGWTALCRARIPHAGIVGRQWLSLARLLSPSPLHTPQQEENITEAVANAHKVWAPPSVPAELRAILEDPAAAAITQQVRGDSGDGRGTQAARLQMGGGAMRACRVLLLAPGHLPAHLRACPSALIPRCLQQSPDFWVLVAALRRFVECEGAGQLPLEARGPGGQRGPAGCRRAAPGAARCGLQPACDSVSSCCWAPDPDAAHRRTACPPPRAGPLHCPCRAAHARPCRAPHASAPLHPPSLCPAGLHTRHARLHAGLPGAAARLPRQGRRGWVGGVGFWAAAGRLLGRLLGGRAAGAAADGVWT